MAHEKHNAEAARCWRLVLGQQAVSNAGLTVEDAAIDSALDALYGTPESAKGGLGDIRESFPSSVVQVMQKDALERLGLQQMRCEAEMLAAVEPDVHLVAALLSRNRVMLDKTRATARVVVGKVADALGRAEQPASRRPQPASAPPRHRLAARHRALRGPERLDGGLGRVCGRVRGGPREHQGGQ